MADTQKMKINWKEVFDFDLDVPKWRLKFRQQKMMNRNNLIDSIQCFLLNNFLIDVMKWKKISLKLEIYFYLDEIR
jgi:hypothetical protein